VATVVCIHGIAQQFKGEETLHQEWSASLRDGIRLANARTAVALDDLEIRFVFYGSLFRPQGRTLSVGIPPLTLEDVTEFEQDLLFQWWTAAARSDPSVIAPDARTLSRAPRSAQAALRALSGSRFFSGLAERAMIFDLVQVRRYFTEPATRDAVQALVADAVDEDTRVIVAHSLGSVAAYEALAANPHWPIRSLVTLGSPLGIRNLIYDRLQPTPMASLALDAVPSAQWPGSARAWTNIADDGDVVALVKDLRPLFGARVKCQVVYNGSQAHAIERYLTAPETGDAILAGLGSGGLNQ
jgi:hypothetical protein